MKCYHSRVDLGAMKEYSTFPKSPRLAHRHHVVYYHIQGIRRDAVDAADCAVIKTGALNIEMELITQAQILVESVSV